MPTDTRTLLQRAANLHDCDLFRIICQIEQLADAIPVAGPKLRGVAMQLRKARPDLRMLMHKSDREITS